MKFKLNENILKYLDTIKLSKNSDIIITDLVEIIYSNNSKYLIGNKKITREILEDLLINNNFVLPKYKSNIIKIFVDNNKNLKYKTQIIIPIKIFGDTQGALILVNTKNLLYMESVQILWTIKKNIQFYFEYKNNNTIRKYENNELFQKKFINEIKNELDKKIYSLVIDRTYKNIDHLLLYIIDELRTSLKGKDLILLNELIELYEQKKELHATHGVVVGSKYKHIPQIKDILNSPNY